MQWEAERGAESWTPQDCTTDRTSERSQALFTCAEYLLCVKHRAEQSYIDSVHILKAQGLITQESGQISIQGELSQELLLGCNLKD